MTIFIAVLFIPYTINFDLEDGLLPSIDVDGSAVEETTKSISSRSTAPVVIPIIPTTPGATTDTEKIFIPLQPVRPFAIRLPSSRSVDSICSLARPDVHSPSWGKAPDMIQPPSRAKSPPPSSILQRSAQKSAKELSMSAKKRTKSKSSPRLTGNERRFSHSNYGIEVSIMSNGGLHVAVDAASQAGLLEEKTWVGTLGMPTDVLTAHVKSNIAERLEDDFESLAVFVNDSDMNGHYEHYCKTILWPVLHYQVPDHPKSRAYEDHSWIFYVKVNQAIGDRIVKNWKRGDVVWIHDYHLLLVPGMIRKQLPDAEIGIFIHSAFPSSEIFRCLAARTNLLEGMLGANLIGFQSEEYVHHFLQTCGRLLNVEATKNGVMLESGRFVDVNIFPIGIHPSALDHQISDTDVTKWVDTISEKYGGKRLIVAREKLDSTRGIRQKLLAYELFLNTHPEYKEKVVLIQIATSSTEDPELSSIVGDIVTRINSTHSTLAHQPLVFLKQDIDYSQWLGLLMVADCLMVTSLREGMNLNGHEFIYCQGSKRAGATYAPLILSEFTGSASVLKDKALLVNPWHHKQCAESIKQALDMSEEERKSRWEEMLDIVVANNATSWYQTYIQQLHTAYREHSVRDSASVPRLSVPVLKKKYDSASRRLILLDYEGTLAAWGSPMDILLSTPKRAIDVLNDLMDDKKNIVYVMSSRMPEEMERLFIQVPGLGLIAENGSFLLEAGSTEWIALVDQNHVESWKEGVRNMLKYYQERIERSKIEELHTTMIFKYNEAEDMAVASRQASEAANHINDACHGQGVQAIPVEHAIIFSDSDINKSSATKIIGDKLTELHTRKNEAFPDFLMVIGDARDDEHVFDWARSMAEKGIRDVTTVTIGQRDTAASATLTQGVTGVLSTLRKLTSQEAST